MYSGSTIIFLIPQTVVWIISVWIIYLSSILHSSPSRKRNFFVASEMIAVSANTTAILSNGNIFSLMGNFISCVFSPYRVARIWLELWHIVTICLTTNSCSFLSFSLSLCRERWYFYWSRFLFLMVVNFYILLFFFFNLEKQQKNNDWIMRAR